MYQTVFVSVVGVILVFKVVFLIMSVIYTLRKKNQESPRGSVASAATTTVSVDSLDEDISTSDEQPHSSNGPHSQSSNPHALVFDTLMLQINDDYQDTSI